MQFQLHLPCSSIGSFLHPLMGASYTEFVSNIVAGPHTGSQASEMRSCSFDALLCGPDPSRNM